MFAMPTRVNRERLRTEMTVRLVLLARTPQQSGVFASRLAAADAHVMSRLVVVAMA